MPTNTPNLNLIKPLVSENYDIAKVTNENADIVDGAIHELAFSKNSGWNSINATLTYASADSPTFVANTSIDLTSVISVGMKLKLTQTTVKYFIVTAITSTTITLYGGTDYTLVNASITLPYFSSMKAPFGFPMSPDKWSVTYLNITQVSQLAATTSTIYNIGSRSVSIPIGLWDIIFETSLQIGVFSTGDRNNTGNVTLSTANNTVNDTFNKSIGTNVGYLRVPVSMRDFITNITKTTYYINVSTDLGPTDIYSAYAKIKAVCAYL